MYYSKDDVYFNQKVSYYPLVDKLKVLTASANIFRRPGMEEHKKSKLSIQLKLESKVPSMLDVLLNQAKNIHDAVQRAKRSISDICLLNQFEYFVTFTFNGELCDRYNHKECFIKIQKWLDNQSRIHKVKYLIVPELHEDGAIHFHGLLSGAVVTAPAQKEGKCIFHKGKQVFNLTSWDKYGFSTVTKIESIEKTASYIMKYVTKDIKKILSRYYFCSQSLVKKPIIEYFHVCYDDIAAKDGAVQYKMPFMDSIYLIITNCWEDIETNGYQYNESSINALLYDS